MVAPNEVAIALKGIRDVLHRKARARRHQPRNWRSFKPDILYGPPSESTSGDSPDSPAPGERNIRLGLDRIRQVVPHKQSWRAVHVGGTNGKGSICAFLAGFFRLAGLSHATFTSPAFPERHNGITINGLGVNRRLYEMQLQHVEARSSRVLGPRFSFQDDEPSDVRIVGELTPFEAETATAFHIFNKMHVKYGIVEVGMGGATDATNIIMDKAVTVISKIDLDHQEYLGNTIKDIARVKAGIMRPGVPCIVDYTNTPQVIRILENYARKIKTEVILSSESLPLLDTIKAKFKLEEHQKQNLLCAAAAFRRVSGGKQVDLNLLLSTQPYLPGRLEKVDVSLLTDGQREKPVLVDGAHNMLGVQALAAYVQRDMRKGQAPVTWVMGISAGKSKPFAELIKTLLKPQDNFAFVEFEQGRNDPKPALAEVGREIGTACLSDPANVYDGPPNITDGLRWACEKAAGGPVVVTGSLYLIRDLYKLDGAEPSRTTKERRPGRAQLARYLKLSQERALTPEEDREFKQARRHWYLLPVGKTRAAYEAEMGKTDWPPQMSEKVASIQREAAFHRRQLEGFRIEVGVFREHANSHHLNGGVGVGIHELEKLIEDHEHAYEEAMSKLKEHSILRNRSRLTPELVQPILLKKRQREMSLDQQGNPVAVYIDEAEEWEDYLPPSDTPAAADDAAEVEESDGQVSEFRWERGLRRQSDSETQDDQMPEESWLERSMRPNQDPSVTINVPDDRNPEESRREQSVSQYEDRLAAAVTWAPKRFREPTAPHDPDFFGPVDAQEDQEESQEEHRVLEEIPEWFDEENVPRKPDFPAAAVRDDQKPEKPASRWEPRKVDDLLAGKPRVRARWEPRKVDDLPAGKPRVRPVSRSPKSATNEDSDNSTPKKATGLSFDNIIRGSRRTS